MSFFDQVAIDENVTEWAIFYVFNFNSAISGRLSNKDGFGYVK